MKIKLTEINLDHLSVKDKLNMASNLILEASLDLPIPVDVNYGRKLNEIRHDLMKFISYL